MSRADPLRWLLLATHVPASGAGGGIVRYTVELARALHARVDVELSVLVSGAAEAFFADLLGDATRLAVVPGHPPTAVRTALERSAALPVLRRPWDVVHGTKHIVPRRSTGRRALTVHDMLILDRPGDYGRVKRRLLPGPYLASIRDADTLLCVSAAARDRLVAHAPATAGRAHVVPLAAPAALHDCAPEPVPALTGTPFALVVGDLTVRRNVPFLLGLWPQVRARHPAATLALVGANSGQAGVAALGRLPDAQLRWCYENAAVVLCPSEQEGFGLPALEAAELGATVVTSTDPALTEVTADRALHLPVGEPGRWVEAISLALASPGPAARPPRRRRTWLDVAAETVEAVLGR